MSIKNYYISKRILEVGEILEFDEIKYKIVGFIIGKYKTNYYLRNLITGERARFEIKKENESVLVKKGISIVK